MGFFHRHVVPVYFAFRRGDVLHCGIISAFVISVDAQWWLVTAGHCIEQVQQNLDAGWSIDCCRLIDSGAKAAAFREPVPFDYSSGNAASLNFDGFDYGLIGVRGNVRALLEANGVVPLDEDVWKHQPNNPESYILVGVPEQLSEVNPDQFTFTTTMHGLVECTKPESGFSESKAPMFYAKIRIGDALSDLQGMSGGPIFSLQRTPDGRVKYWLHAVQSGWDKSQSVISGCLMAPFVVEVQNITRRSGSDRTTA